MDTYILITIPTDERSTRLAEASTFTKYNIRNRKDTHASGEIRTRNPSKRAATGLLLRPRDRRGWLGDSIQIENMLSLYCYLSVLGCKQVA